MKVKVIGTGSMWTLYNSASYLIDEDILVDIPNGTCKNLFRMGISPKQINNVLITHFHGDHYFDMPFYLLLKSKADNKKVNIFCNKKEKNKIIELFKLGFPNSTKSLFKEIELTYNFNKDFSVGNYNVEKVLVDHGRMKPAYGYIFTFKNKKVGFTGDTTICENVEYMAKSCDYLFCDCMLIKSSSKHMGIDSIKYLSEKYPNCQYVASHLEDTTRKELNNIKLKNVIVIEDGEVIKI